jgi:hypothetical protein
MNLTYNDVKDDLLSIPKVSVRSLNGHWLSRTCIPHTDFFKLPLKLEQKLNFIKYYFLVDWLRNTTALYYALCRLMQVHAVNWLEV